ncbi:tetratricopeptide repeat protein [Aerophototrophica crusticola]|uniref:Tetratricopeptide repeat protein n=1 Tax=Aerophototrophica crusticola TaxID=1709002 RepID=A0A858R644_9PROT|nr:tetratricopeptide repeat protein [Rhodospirillaceae bacterium B3]
MRRAGLTAAIALLAGLPSLAQEVAAPAPATAQPPAAVAPAPAAVVGVRGGIHPDYNRLVFDWTKPTEYRVSRDGNRVTVTFPVAATANLTPASRTRLARISGLTQTSRDGMLSVSFTVPDGAVVRDSRIGPRVVLDVADPPKTAASPGQAVQPQQAASPAKAPPAQVAQQQPAPAAKPPTAEEQAAARRQAEGAPLFQIRGNQQTPPVPGNPATAQAAPAPTPDTASPATAAPTPLMPPNPGKGSPAAAPAPTTQAQAQPAPAAKVAAQPAAGAPVAPAPAAEQQQAAQSVTLVFDPKIPAAAAVFERAGWLYVLFDREVPPGTAPAPGSVPGLTTPVEPVQVPEGAGFRLPSPALLEGRVQRDGTAWRVVLERPAGQAVTSLPVQADPDFALGARLVVQAEDADKVLTFTDPVVGDRLRVAPLPVPDNRVAAPERYAEAQLLPTLQGIVVRPLHDQLLVQPVREGVELTVPGGLRLSPEEDVRVANPPPVVSEPDRLYDYKRWGQVPADQYMRTRQARWDAMIAQPEAIRNRGRLDLARFYLANGMGPEALGMLALVQEKQPDVDRRAEFLAVRGPARLLSGDFKGGAEDLSAASLDAEPDTDLWRALAASGLGDPGRAHDLFSKHKELLSNYPELYFTRMSLAAADAALQRGQAEAAALVVDRLVRRGSHKGPQAAAVNYMRGAVFAALGDTDKSEKAFQEALAGNDRLYQVRADMDLVDLRLKAGKITPKQAAEEMEKLRFAWRGDQLELAVQRRIGDTHVKAGNYAQAFDTMKRTISLFPDDPAAKEIAAQITRTFTDLFGKDGAAHLSPLEALALYEQYRELTPPGPDGDRIIQMLAGRLVEIDLLDRAGTLLDHQVQFRLAGEEKARVGARLAGIRLLDSRPEEALAALDKSEMQGLPGPLAEERRLLRARALSQTARSGDALQLLTADQSRPANLLRIDIAMRDKQWKAAAQALGDVIGPPPPAGQALDPQVVGLVVNRAVALSLAQDNVGLDKLRQDFGTAMEKSREATAFRVLTRPGEAAGLVDARTIQGRMAEIDLFRSFLDSYRTKPGGNAAPAPTGAGQQAQAPR